MMGNTNQQITTFLMFERIAEEAMNNYASVFADSKIEKMLHNPGGTIMHATFTLRLLSRCLSHAIQQKRLTGFLNSYHWMDKFLCCFRQR